VLKVENSVKCLQMVGRARVERKGDKKICTSKDLIAKDVEKG